MHKADDRVLVALLYQSEELGRHLREALAPVAGNVVYEAATDEVDRVALEKSGARVVVVNLDPDLDSDIDDVYELLADDRYQTVFNDGHVTSQLSGWDQARWSRHLLAKVNGAQDSDPPRPVGADAVPVANEVAASFPQNSAVDMPAVAERAAVVAGAPTQADQLDLSVLDFGDLAGEAAGEFLLETHAEAKPVPDTLEELDSAEFDRLFGESDPDSEPSVIVAWPGVNEEALPEIAAAPSLTDLDTSMLGDPVDTEVDAEAEAGPDFDFSFPAAFALADNDAPAEQPDPAAVVVEPELSDGVPPEADAPDWTLETLFESALAPPPPLPGAAFGIQTVSAAEFLAPDVGDTGASPIDATTFDFELVPMEEAVAPRPIEEQHHESWLDPSHSTRIKRVWVLAASIGGPEAIREFLGNLPRDFPALFVVAQHIGPEFIDLMAQQIASATILSVRVPSHGERVSHGEVLLVPPSQRLLVDNEGVVVLKAVEQSGAYLPSIDQVLTDMADRHGRNAGAIIFSGMGEDAIEGSVYLASKGGVVHAQDPASCVVSTMVDNVRERGVVGFVGSPRELAAHLREQDA